MNSKASNIACRAELGRYPLILDVNKRNLKYSRYLQSKEQSSLVIQSLVMSIDLHGSGKTSFYTNLIKVFDYYNIPFNFNHDKLDDTKIMHSVDRMQKKYITHWKLSLCNSQKFEFYNVFKDRYTPSTYLDVTRKNPNRKTLVKLRISNHKLNIETGRYDKISRCHRICPVYGLNIEDEIHFLFNCPKYSSIREDFFNKIENRIPDYKHISISTLIIQLMNFTDYYLDEQLVRYVSSCLEMRDNLISKV